MIEFQRISARPPAECYGMTFSVNAPLLDSLVPNSPAFAITVLGEGTVIGFGLGRMDTANTAEILSLFVTPPRWSRGIGTELLERLEAIARERGASKARIAYSTQGKSNAALERLLQKRGWSEPRAELLLAHFGRKIVRESPWITELRIKPPYEIFGWHELTPTQRGSLEAARETIPTMFWPFIEEKTIDPRTSVGLRLGPHVVGWMITHRVAPLVVRYTMLYVRPPWQRASLSFGLLAESIRRIDRAAAPDERGALAVRMDNQPMLRALQRKFRPYAETWNEMRVAGKSLL